LCYDCPYDLELTFLLDQLVQSGFIHRKVWDVTLYRPRDMFVDQFGQFWEKDRVVGHLKR